MAIYLSLKLFEEVVHRGLVTGVQQMPELMKQQRERE